MPSPSHLGRSCFSALACVLGLVLLAAGPALGQPIKASAKATPSQDKVHAGDRLVVAVEIEYEKGWHSWPNKPVVPKELGDDFEPIASTITGPDNPVGYTVHTDRIQWPAAKALESAAFSGTPVTILSYGEKIVVFVPVTVAKDAKPGTMPIELSFGFQACDDTSCVAPAEISANSSVEVVDGGTAVTAGTFSGVFGAFDQGVWTKVTADPPAPSLDRSVAGSKPTGKPPTPPTGAQGSPATTQPSTVRDFGAFGVSLLIDTNGFWGIVLVSLAAVLGGALLNFMPCVLPIIPIKMLGLKEAAKSPARYFMLGAVTSLGVVVFWLGLGAVIALSSTFKATSQLAAYWQYNIGIGLFLLAMGIGLVGVFNMGLPTWIYNINPRHDTAKGCFFWGVLTAALSIPCTGPVMGTAAAWATDQPLAVTLLVFTALGVGMALPYFVLSIRVEWVRWLPRAGPGSELLKQVMGLVVLAVSVWFIGNGIVIIGAQYPFVAKTLHYWVAAAALLAATVWMTYRLVNITSSAMKRVVFPVLGLALVGGMGAWAMSETSDARNKWSEREAQRMADQEALAGGNVATAQSSLWREFSQASFDAARKQGKVVVLDYTADWCLTCKVLMKHVLNEASVKNALSDASVVTFEVDCTSINAPGWAALRALRQSGVPYLVVYGPGQDEPIFQSNAYTIAQVLDAVAKAGGGVANK